jgi:dTMP kinase
MADRGLFVTLEGGEGAGKSTQALRLRAQLEALGRRVVQAREPGGTKFGEELRELLLSSTRIATRTEMLLFMAARSEVVDKVIKPSLTRGIDVICDRFIDSTMAYQGYGRGVSRTLIKTVNDAVIQGSVPDLTILLDIEPSQGLARASEGAGGDAIEGHWQTALGLGEGEQQKGTRVGGRDLAFHVKVREGYLALAKAEPERWLVLDGLSDPDDIAAAIWARAEALLNARTGDASRG